MKNSIAFASCLSLAAMLWSFNAVAQNNQPFAFGSVIGGSINGSTSTGMSAAGREAILNEKLFGSRPSNLIVGPNGALLNVSEGPGGIAVVSERSSPVVPQVRGSFTSQFGGIGLQSFGGSSSLTGSGLLNASALTTAAISGWIDFVQGRRSTPASASTRNTIDSWTSQVF